ncbi:MAG: hypothetical protein B7X28_00970, partial [Halothiobacillus sp. 13-55-253]
MQQMEWPLIQILAQTTTLRNLREEFGSQSSETAPNKRCLNRMSMYKLLKAVLTSLVLFSTVFLNYSARSADLL